MLRRRRRLLKTIGNLCYNVNDFVAILYDNSKLFNLYFKFLYSGPTFYELVTCKSFFIKEIQIISLNIENNGKGLTWNLRFLYIMSRKRATLLMNMHVLQRL